MNEDAVREFKRAFGDLHRSARTITLSLKAVDAYAIVLQLQLALKHPQNQGPSAAIAILVAKQLEHELGDIDRSLRDQLRRGWEQAYGWHGIGDAQPPDAPALPAGKEQLP